MDIKTLLGEAWKDGMTLDEINAAISDRNFVDPTSLPKSVNKDIFDKTASDLAKTKKELNDLKASSMTAEERIKTAQDEANTARTAYQKELSKLKVQGVLQAAGLTDKDMTTLMDSIVGEDVEVSVGRANDLAKMITAQRKSAQDALRLELLKDTPKPAPGETGEGAMTKDKFLKLPFKDQETFITANPNWQQILK